MDVQSLGCRLSVQTDAVKGVPHVVLRIHGVSRDSDDAVYLTVAEVDTEAANLSIRASRNRHIEVGTEGTQRARILRVANPIARREQDDFVQVTVESPVSGITYAEG